MSRSTDASRHLSAVLRLSRRQAFPTSETPHCVRGDNSWRRQLVYGVTTGGSSCEPVSSIPDFGDPALRAG
jgi:hypothetical protein